MPRERMALRFARMLERRSPRLAQRVAAPRVDGARHSPGTGGTVECWTPIALAGGHTAPDPTTMPLVIVVTDRVVSARWLSASLSVALHARVVVGDAAALTGEQPEADAIVGIGRSATAAIELCRKTGSRRLALVSPVALPTPVPSGLPTTLIQSSGIGVERPMVEEFQRTLRATGTAVRDTDYLTTADEWVRLPRLVHGSASALDDLVAFLLRGTGVQSTFEVIPGWDLH